MHRRPFLCGAGALIWLVATGAVAQQPSAPYVVRMAREDSINTVCVLLDEAGKFHYEAGDWQAKKVYEGHLTPAQLASVRQDVQVLSQVSQSDIEDPLIQGPRNLLNVHIFHGDKVKELQFRSAESQQPFAAKLNPLLNWMVSLPRLPHQQLSEDSGKQNCLPRNKVALKKRDEVPPQPPLTRRPVAGRTIAPPPVQLPTPVQLLLGFGWTEKTSSAMHQRCALIADNGQFRFEFRSQKIGSKKVEDRLARGQLSAEDLRNLRTILNAPVLTRLRHREPPGRMPLNIMGSVLELRIGRSPGVQELVLTDTKHRNTFFYAGDGDISIAEPILKLTREKMQAGALAATSASELNGCSGLP